MANPSAPQHAHPARHSARPSLTGVALALSLAAALAGCASAPPPAAPPAPVLAKAAEAETIVLTLKMNEATTLAANGMVLTFTGVRDSRCPTDVRCITAGEVLADLWAEPADGTPLQVTVGEPLSNPARAGGQQFCFLDLAPRPRSSEPVAQSAYTLTFSVTPLAAGTVPGCNHSAATR